MPFFMVRTPDNWEAESRKIPEYQGKTAQKLAQYGLKAARRAPQFSKRWLSAVFANLSERFTAFLHDCVRKVGIVWSRGMQQIALELAEKAAHNKRICSRLPQRHKSYRRRCFPQGKHLLLFCLRKNPHLIYSLLLLCKKIEKTLILKWKRNNGISAQIWETKKAF